jgi:ActR/RegA family two-component response regulator
MKTRVLLVDDDADFAENLAERLALREYVVSTSFSGEDAIRKVSESLSQFSGVKTITYIGARR